MIQLTANQWLMHALHVLNFDLLKDDGRSAMEIHFSEKVSLPAQSAVPVWWSPIGSSQWLTGNIKVWGKGFVCHYRRPVVDLGAS